MEETVEALRACGHEMVEVEFPLARRAYCRFMQHIASDKIAAYDEIKGDDDCKNQFLFLPF